MTVEKRRLKEGTEDEYETVKEDETLNSMIPLWKRIKKRLSPRNMKLFIKISLWTMKSLSRLFIINRGSGNI